MRTVSARSSPSGSGRSGGDMRRTLGWRRGDQARELRRRGGAGAGDRARGGAPGALRRSRGFRTGAPGGRLRAAGGRLPRRLGGRGAGRLRRRLPLRRDDGRAPADVRRSRGARARPLARAARGAGGRGAESRLRLRPAGDGRPSAGGDRTLRLLGLPADLATPAAYATSQTSVIVQKSSPSASMAANEAPPSGANCGRRLVKKTAIFGFPRLLSTPWRNAVAGARVRRGAPAAARLPAPPRRQAAT